MCRMGFSLQILRDEIALRAETTVRYFILVLSYTLTSFPEPLPQRLRCSGRSLEPSGKLPIKSIQILLIFVGWMTHSKLFLAMPLNGSLSFCLHHQGLERNLEDLGCFFQLLFLCINGINRRDTEVWSISSRSCRETFRSSKVSSLNVGLQSKNWKTSW